MTMTYPMTLNCLILMLLVISVSLQWAVADTDEEEDCGNGCQSYDQDTPQMTRCVRYACRRRVFRYFIRFGKRSGMSTEELARGMQKLHFPQYPLHERLSKRYKKPEITGPYRYQDREDIEDRVKSLDEQSNSQLSVDQIIHILRNHQRKNNLLRKMFWF